MKHELKRPIKAYLFEILSIAVPIWFLTSTSSELAHSIFIVAAAVRTITLIYMIIRAGYIKVSDNKLIIYDTLFRTTSIELDRIEKFEIEPHPFRSSKIILKDKSSVKYSDMQVNDEKLKGFMAQFDILVG